MKRILFILSMCFCFTFFAQSQEVYADATGSVPQYSNAMEFFDTLGLESDFESVYKETSYYFIRYKEWENSFDILELSDPTFYLCYNGHNFKVVWADDTPVEASVKRYRVLVSVAENGEYVWKSCTEIGCTFDTVSTSQGVRMYYGYYTSDANTLYASRVAYSDFNLYSGNFVNYETEEVLYYSDRKEQQNNDGSNPYLQVGQFTNLLEWLHYHGYTCFDTYYDESKKYVVVPSYNTSLGNGFYNCRTMRIYEINSDGYIASLRYAPASSSNVYVDFYVYPFDGTLSYTYYDVATSNNTCTVGNSYADRGSVNGRWQTTKTLYVYENEYPVLYTDFPVYDYGSRENSLGTSANSIDKVNVPLFCSSGTGVICSGTNGFPYNYFVNPPTPSPTPMPSPTPTPVIELPDIDLGDIDINDGKYEITKEGVWFNDIFYPYHALTQNHIANNEYDGYAVLYDKESNKLSIYWTKSNTPFVVDFDHNSTQRLYMMIFRENTEWVLCQYIVNDDATLTGDLSYYTSSEGYFSHYFFTGLYGDMDDSGAIESYREKCLDEALVYSNVPFVYDDDTLCRDENLGLMQWDYILNDIGKSFADNWKENWNDIFGDIKEFISVAKGGISDIYRAVKEVSAEGKAPSIVISFDEYYGLDGDYEVLSFLWLVPYLSYIHLFLSVIIWVSTVVWMWKYLPKVLGGIG